MSPLTKTWEDGVRKGEYRNPGTRKHKKRGKPSATGKLRIGIHKIRMARRRGQQI